MYFFLKLYVLLSAGTLILQRLKYEMRFDEDVHFYTSMEFPILEWVVWIYEMYGKLVVVLLPALDIIFILTLFLDTFKFSKRLFHKELEFLPVYIICIFVCCSKIASNHVLAGYPAFFVYGP